MSRAWAIVCASGKFHRVEHKGHRLYVTEEDADRMANWHDLIRLKCGPHKVLTGTFRPSPRRKRR